MSTIDSAGKAQGIFVNRNPKSVSGATQSVDFANSVKRAASPATKSQPGIAVAKTIASTGRELDTSAKLKEFLANPAKRQSLQNQLSQLSQEIRQDLSLDTIAQLPARDLAIIRGVYSLLSAENRSRLELIR